MKAIIITAAAAAFFVILSFRPPISGVYGKCGLYLTHDDFQNSRLSYASPTDGSENKIKIRQGLFGSATVGLIYNGKKEVFPFNRVYGYRDAKGQDYRFFGSQAYRILDTAGFYLYSISKLVQGEKIARPQLLYYFSTDPDGDLQLLSRGSLEHAFAGNARFRYSIEAFEGKFGSDSDLAAYDYALSTYKIKYLYAQSLQ